MRIGLPLRASDTALLSTRDSLPQLIQAKTKQGDCRNSKQCAVHFWPELSCSAKYKNDCSQTEDESYKETSEKAHAIGGESRASPSKGLGL